MSLTWSHDVVAINTDAQQVRKEMSCGTHSLAWSGRPPVRLGGLVVVVVMLLLSLLVPLQ